MNNADERIIKLNISLLKVDSKEDICSILFLQNNIIIKPIKSQMKVEISPWIEDKNFIFALSILNPI